MLYTIHNKGETKCLTSTLLSTLTSITLKLSVMMNTTLSLISTARSAQIWLQSRAKSLTCGHAASGLKEAPDMSAELARNTTSQIADLRKRGFAVLFRIVLLVSALISSAYSTMEITEIIIKYGEFHTFLFHIAVIIVSYYIIRKL
jgi:hypothetical protein